MENLIKDFLNQKSFAVAGSFSNETKVAWRIFKSLKKRGYEVYPVNPRITEVEGVKCYSSVKDIPTSIDVVNIVTPPKITANIIKECKEMSINRVWIQPGAENEEVINFCKQNSINIIHGLCVMLETN